MKHQRETEGICRVCDCEVERGHNGEQFVGGDWICDPCFTQLEKQEQWEEKGELVHECEDCEVLTPQSELHCNAGEHEAWLCVDCGNMRDEDEGGVLNDAQLIDALDRRLEEAQTDGERNAVMCARLMVLHCGMPKRLEKIVASILARKSSGAQECFDFFWGFLHEDGPKRHAELSDLWDELLPEATLWVHSIQQHMDTLLGGEA